eukprot:2485644-Pleurochrysis_carterae.AAC.1
MIAFYRRACRAVASRWSCPENALHTQPSGAPLYESKHARNWPRVKYGRIFGGSPTSKSTRGNSAKCDSPCDRSWCSMFTSIQLAPGSAAEKYLLSTLPSA